MTFAQSCATAPSISTVTLWQSLTNTAGTRHNTTWGDWFARLETPREIGLAWNAKADPIPRMEPAKRSLSGWSAATFIGDYRAKKACESVSALVLDYDGGSTVAEATALWAQSYGLLHTSPKHLFDPGVERFRVILPFSRPAAVGEYAEIWAWAEKRAAAAGQILDPTPKDPSRFWYMPGIVKGAPFETRHLSGEPIDVDAILADGTAPVAKLFSPKSLAAPKEARADKYVSAAVSKACEAIRTAPNGSRNATLNRESFSVAGLAATGAIDTESTRTALRDAAVDVGLDGREIEATLKSSFDAGLAKPREVPAPRLQVVRGDNEDWRSQLRTKETKDGELVFLPTVDNLALILMHDHDWRGIVAWDNFAHRVVKLGCPPCPAGFAPKGGTLAGDWTDEDDSLLQVWLARTERYGMNVGKESIADAVRIAARRATYHPLQDYLNGLSWDGQPRVDSWLSEYLGAATDEYTGKVGRWWLISAVARAMRPGCQVDTMLVLVGKQGIAKSSALRALVPNQLWFSDTDLELDSKDCYLSLSRRWIYELSELHALTKSEASRVKAFVSSREDNYREPYGHRNVCVPRQVVFAGTTNHKEFLRDDTGNRRFWPVDTTTIDVAAIERVRDQLWAEAVALYSHGAPWWPDSTDAEVCREKQEERRQADPWEDKIADYLDNLGDQSSGVTSSNVLFQALGIFASRQTRADQMRAGAILNRLGWVRTRSQDGNSRAYVYKNHGSHS